MRLRTGVGDHNLVRICVDDEIWVMRHHDNLPSRLRRRKYRDEFIEYRLRVQILLGLVDNQWSVIVVVKREVQQQKNYAARAWRQFFDRVWLFFVDRFSPCS